jgi:hypothetical protein
MIDRRSLIAGIALAPMAPRVGLAKPAMTVFKDANCGCCGVWVEHARAAGFAVEVRLESQMSRVKARLGVPADLTSCHTAIVDGYVIEGHVPSEAIVKLLRERPRLSGIAVPGMPIGSPGMEITGQTPEPFTVIGFDVGNIRRVFSDYPKGFQR